MKIKLLMLSLLVVLAVPAWGQDLGNPDTVRFEVVIDTIGLQAEFELWVYNDANTLASVSYGFAWDNPNFAMDTALPTALTASAFDLGVFLFKKESIDSSNVNRNFLFGGARLFSDGLLPADTAQLWATYSFTFDSWTNGDDGITVDTLHFNEGSVAFFVPVAGTATGYVPTFAGRTSICCKEYPNVDPGQRDTVAVTVELNADSSEATMRLYGYWDEDLRTIALGFSWDNPLVQMVSATGSSLQSESDLRIGPYFYEDSALNVTNANNRFLYYHSTSQSSSEITAVATRRLIATYVFDISGMSKSGKATVDTMKFNNLTQTAYKRWGNLFGFEPYWEKGTNPVVVLVDFTDDVQKLEDNDLPQTFSLGQNYPNPFNPTTQVEFDVPRLSHVTIAVYNILGQEVVRLVDEEMSAGSYVVDWTGTTERGTDVTSGIYFYKMEADNFRETRKMMLIR